MEFTDQELELLSLGVLRLMEDESKAKALVFGDTALKAIDNELAVLRNLNSKICNYMEG